MRFTCEHCGKRYLTSDVLQPGRVYRTKCKGCGSPITVTGTAEAAGTTTGELPAPTGRTSSPSLASLTPATPTPPAIPVPPAARPPPAAPAPRYIDLFDGPDTDASPPEPPPPARPAPRVPPPVAPSARAPVIPAPPAPDPFSAAMEDAPTPGPGSALLAPSARAPEEEPEPETRRGLFLLGAAAVALLAVLVVGAIWRPWLPSPRTSTAGAPPSTTPAPPKATPTDAPPTAAAPAPQPAAALQPAPADEAKVRAEAEAKREQERLAAAAAEQQRREAEAAEKARLAEESARRKAEEKDRAKTARVEKERLAKEQKERTKAERAEKERLAREQKERERAARAEKERLAKEEKVAKVEALPQGLSPDAVQAALSGGRAAFEECFRDQARGAAPPIDASQVIVRFLVQPSGIVTVPEVADPEVAQLPAAQCLKSVAAGLKFAAFRGEATRVEAPVAIPAPPRASKFVAIEFTGFHSARGGGDVGDTVYSERANDAVITERTFADGMVTYAGQVGMGEGSQYAGIGINVNMYPGPKAIDATRFKSMTIRLAATTSTLRIRIIGADNGVRTGGCYPVKLQRVSATPKDYVLEFSDFAPEGWCGSKGRSTASTLKELVGFEIADISVEKKPVTITTGTIILNP